MNAPAELALTERPTSPSQVFSLAPRNLDEAFRLADLLADSEMVPKDFKGRPGNCLIAIQWGAEVGLKPLQSLQNIAVVNGRPSLWGDALIALVRSSPLCEYVLESIDANGTAVCQVKRRGEQESMRTFSDADAKTAGLLGKAGPWSTNPNRMKQMRARAFALRDVFPDVLKGMAMAEEAFDFIDNLTPSTPLRTAPVPPCNVDPKVLSAAREAADKGREAFAAWWKAATKEQRAALRAEVPDLQARTEKADAARATGNNAPATADAAVVEEAEDPWIAALDAGEQAA